jgi:membrane protein DedA with SNARE-associated domain
VEARESGEPATRRRRRLWWLLAPIVALTALAYAGDILYADLANRNPYLLIALNTRKRYLALVVPNTEILPYFVVGLTRQVISDPLFFLIGRWYGDAGVRWLERRMGDSGGMIRAMERGFAAAAYPMVAIFPNALICMLAGASRMRTWIFLVLNIGGTFVAMVLLRAFGQTFSGPIESLLGFFARYRWPIVAISAVIVGLSIARSRRQGRGELESVTEMERELEKELEEGPDPSP